MDNPQILGLIAGNGKFPILLARKAHQKKIKVIAVGIKGDTSVFLRMFVDKFCWFAPGELKKLFSFFKEEGVQNVIMAGQVNPDNLFDERAALDDEFKVLFSELSDRKADTIFKAIADKLKQEKIELLDSTFLIKEYMAPKGTLTKRGPTQGELEDIDFGKNIAKAMGEIDVGQTVVVKEKAILAIEAMEGTDRAILRGGQIARKGAVVVKVSKPKQDKRFDVPVIGPRTLQMLISCKASCIAIESDKTLFIDRDRCVKLANKADICIVSF